MTDRPFESHALFLEYSDAHRQVFLSETARADAAAKAGAVFTVFKATTIFAAVAAVAAIENLVVF
jgi:hypothetical protein